MPCETGPAGGAPMQRGTRDGPGVERCNVSATAGRGATGPQESAPATPSVRSVGRNARSSARGYRTRADTEDETAGDTVEERHDDSTLSSVRNAARLLAAFTPADRDLGVTELARRLALPKSSVHRLLTALVSEGLVTRGEGHGRYRLGVRLYELGQIAPSRAELHAVSLVPLDELHARTGEMAHVAVLDGTDVVVVERRETPGLLLLAARLGHRHPAHTSSSGKVLLAYLPLAERQALLRSGELAASTPHSITDRARLEEELAKVRSRGWAESWQELTLGVASISAPVRDARGRVVAAAGVSGPVTRIDRGSSRRLAYEAGRASLAISTALGYRPREPGHLHDTATPAGSPPSG